MNSFLVLTILFGVLATHSLAFSEEKLKALKDCQEQEKASDDDVQAFKSHKVSPTGKCFAACVFEKLGVIKDGKIDGDTIKANFKKDKGDSEKFIKAIDTCQSLTNTDRCELALQFSECMKNARGPNSETST